MDWIRVSAGTAHQLKLKEIKCDELPTTGYLMDHHRCKKSCAFCSQSSVSQGPSHRLSRVTWPEFPLETLKEVLRGNHPLKRLCLQVTQYRGVLEETVEKIKKIKESSPLPLCISGGARSLEDVEKLLEAGVDKVSIAIDAVNPKIFAEIKKGDWFKVKELILTGAQKFPGRISTHVIAGLGETPREMVDFLHEVHNAKVSVALFAFTPIKGTPMEKVSPPDITYYRRVQLINYCYKEGIPLKVEFDNKGQFSKIGENLEDILKIIGDGKAFQTSGCEHCNRPYYNEKPGKTMYNYPRPLKEEELLQAISELNLKEFY
ncbi:biotin synthase [Anaerobranca californiensis DSM 14826]|uniref:biotin synthase n=1 Tax=Anaerobranca californiensis DSM 14826 TaxID=1120989 RepID=A0A1M6L8Q3_9FIRM|nr:radical SAM protein [Anaerobranca californiensis]SHJ67545.1 biotin synthase [Anaerobranca californiensis DSM 14826]